MLHLDIIIIDTNEIPLEKLLDSSFIFESDLPILNKFKVLEVKKEKAASTILKNKYIQDYKLNEFGKPINDKTYFNVSHSHGMVVFVQDDVPIGIDIEKIRPFDPKLAEYVSSKEELEYIKEDKNFYEIWTNKEAIAKNIGTGIKGKIKDITSLPLNGKKHYQNKDYFSKTIQFKDYIISIIRETNEEFDIIIKEEKI